MTGFLVFLGTLMLHAATSWRYGYFRDELYFIACAKHLSWGYVDQPPLVAVAAWLSSPAGYSLPALRALPVLAAALAAWVASAIARDLGGGRFAQLTAGATVALMPAYLLLGNTLTTTSFEALSWSLVVWCLIRIVRGGSVAWWLGLAASVAFGFYGKYSIVLLVVSIAIGLLCTSHRSLFASSRPYIATAIALALVAPNVVWQSTHGWPMFEVLAGDAAYRHAFNTGLQLEYRSVISNATAFVAEQFLYAGAISSVLWITGLIAPFRMPTLRDLRWLCIAYVTLFCFAIALGAKGYYIIGIYGGLVAVGSVALERCRTPLRYAAVAAILVFSLVALPLSIPILSVPQLISYTQVLGLTGRNGAPPRLIQPVFAEEFGWERLAKDVARIYFALPPAQRASTAIYADTYADAGAVDFFGPRFGLPNAIGSQNTYWLWGTRGYSGSPMIAIGATRITVLSQFYRSCRLVGTSDEPLKWVVEGPSPIYFCTGPKERLDQIWPSLRWYGA